MWGLKPGAALCGLGSWSGSQKHGVSAVATGLWLLSGRPRRDDTGSADCSEAKQFMRPMQARSDPTGSVLHLGEQGQVFFWALAFQKSYLEKP